jgi:hypothetical protein
VISPSNDGHLVGKKKRKREKEKKKATASTTLADGGRINQPLYSGGR